MPEKDRTASDAPYLITCLNNPLIPRPLFTIEGEDRVQSLAYSKCGSQLARAEEQQVVLCDPVSGFELHRFLGHTGLIRSVAFSPNRKQVASGSDDQTVRIWNIETGACEWTVRVGGVVFSIDFAPCGTKLAATCNNFNDGSFSVQIFSKEGSTGNFVCQSTLRGHRYAPSLSKECFLSLGWY